MVGESDISDICLAIQPSSESLRNKRSVIDDRTAREWASEGGRSLVVAIVAIADIAATTRVLNYNSP